MPPDQTGLFPKGDTMMKRALILAAAMALGVTGAAYAQGTASSKSGWSDNSKISCLEPYAPAVPKAEDTTVKELKEKVRPDIEDFIKESNKYLDCIGLQIAKAKEEGDQEKLRELVKAHNDNVKYQKSIAAEFNNTVQALKAQAKAGPIESGGASGKSGETAAAGEKPDESEAAESSTSDDGSEKAAEAAGAGDDGEKSAETAEAAEAGEEKKADAAADN